MVSDNDRIDLLIGLRRYADAEAAAREAIGRDPQWAAGYTQLARALMCQLKGAAAVEAAAEGARQAPQDAWAAGVLACALHGADRTPEALDAAERAVRLNPRYAWTYAVLANVRFSLGRYAEARETAAAGLRLDPHEESLLRWKGWCEHKLSEHRDALRTAEAGLKSHPNSHLLLNLIGCVKWTQAEHTWGRARLRLHREADAKLRDAIRLDPTQPVYRDNLRGNARSCRQNLLLGLLLVTSLLFSAVPAVAIGLATLAPAKHKLAAVGAAAVVAVGMSVAFASGERGALAAPLGRLGAPSAPLQPWERRRGRLELAVAGLFLLLPYVVLACFL